LPFITWRERSSFRIASAGISHIVVWSMAVEMPTHIAVNLVQLVFGQAETGEPVDESGENIWVLP